MRLLYLHDKDGDVIVNASSVVAVLTQYDGAMVKLDSDKSVTHVYVNETPAEIAAMIDAMHGMRKSEKRARGRQGEIKMVGPVPALCIAAAITAGFFFALGWLMCWAFGG